MQNFYGLQTRKTCIGDSTDTHFLKTGTTPACVSIVYY